MRFIHTGDIHLGAHPENKREWAKDQETKSGEHLNG